MPKGAARQPGRAIAMMDGTPPLCPTWALWRQQPNLGTAACTAVRSLPAAGTASATVRIESSFANSFANTFQLILPEFCSFIVICWSTLAKSTGRATALGSTTAWTAQSTCTSLQAITHHNVIQGYLRRLVVISSFLHAQCDCTEQVHCPWDAPNSTNFGLNC